MQNQRRLMLRSFYENELKNRFLSYWLPRCEDKERGGFVNCFTNDGKMLVSWDKYCWSQGRFVWMFAKLATLSAPIFSEDERKEFLRLAKQGTAFLMEHGLICQDPPCCAFLLDADGRAKPAEGCDRLDASVYADCFVAMGIAKYAQAAMNKEAYGFAKRLFDSIVLRIRTGEYATLPYPLSPCYRAHGIPMILENVTAELYHGAETFAHEDCGELLTLLEAFTEEVLLDFADGHDRIREVIHGDGRKLDRILGEHINPGHTLEDVWFILDFMELTGRRERRPQVYRIAKTALETGWDEAYGGLLHFAGLCGGEPKGKTEGVETESMTLQLSGWDNKLWWVHSEALYTTLRCWIETGDEDFWRWHERVRAYTYATFPNPDTEIGEWIQIRNRDGTPADRVVALPVKDPYHVIRNLMLMLELLYKE